MKCYVFPVFLYGLKSWVLTKKKEKIRRLLRCDCAGNGYKDKLHKSNYKWIQGNAMHHQFVKEEEKNFAKRLFLMPMNSQDHWLTK